MLYESDKKKKFKEKASSQGTRLRFQDNNFFLCSQEGHFAVLQKKHTWNPRIFGDQCIGPRKRRINTVSVPIEVISLLKKCGKRDRTVDNRTRHNISIIDLEEEAIIAFLSSPIS